MANLDEQLRFPQGEL